MRTDLKPQRHPARVAAQMVVVMLASVAVAVTSAATGLGADWVSAQPAPDSIGPVALTLTPLLQTSTTVPAQPIHFPRSQFGIDMESHGTHTSAGDGFAEVINTWHNGRNIGVVPDSFLIVFESREGMPATVRP